MSEQTKKPEASQVREFWIDRDGQNLDPDEIYFGSALVRHPQQGPLAWQYNLIHVIEFAAYDKLQAENERLKEQQAWKSLGANVVPDQANVEGLLTERDELESENAALKTHLETLRECSNNKFDEIQRQRKQIEILKAGLEYYADKNNITGHVQAKVILGELRGGMDMKYFEHACETLAQAAALDKQTEGEG